MVSRNKKCFEGTDVDVASTVQKEQRSIVNFKSASTVLVEILSGGPILPIPMFIGHLLFMVSINLMLMQ